MLSIPAITGNYNAFRDEGLSANADIAETLDCYAEAGLDTIETIVYYRALHRFRRSLEGFLKEAPLHPSMATPGYRAERRFQARR